MSRRRLRRIVRERANCRCEYCLFHERDFPLWPFHLEHILPRRHGGQTKLSNLCWSCQFCNLAKGTNLSGIDPLTGKIVPLFHPRKQNWSRHFRLFQGRLMGSTVAGRATIHALRMNLAHRIALRKLLIQQGLFP